MVKNYLLTLILSFGILFGTSILTPSYGQAKEIRVSLLLFSGLPDPQLSMTQETDIEILKGFLQNLPPTTDPVWPQFGMRGFLLANKMVTGFPEEVRVFQGVIRIVEGDTHRFFEDLGGLETYLAQLFSNNEISTLTPEQSLSTIQNNNQLPTSGDEPPYEPDKWNDNDGVQHNNNCYNYACNKQTGTFAQPGRVSIGAITQDKISCSSISVAAISDGLFPWSPDVACPGMFYKKALVVGTKFDYHWYRQDNNGNWSHKPGQTEATDKDADGKPITDPRTAARGPYPDFCGFFCCAMDQSLVGIR